MKHQWIISITGIAWLSGCAGQSVLVGEEGTGGTTATASSASGGLTGSGAANNGVATTSSGGASSVVATTSTGGAAFNGTTGGVFNAGGSSPFPVPGLPRQPADLLGCTGGEAVTLPPTVVATRLAAFIYQGAPDAPLLAAANAGSLSTTAGIACQARRMLGTPEATAGVRELFRAWLGYGPTPLGDPRYSVDYATYYAMTEETDSFANYVFFSPASSFEDLLTAPYTFLNVTLAAHYGIAIPASAQGFVHTPLPAERSGILTQGAFLTPAPGPANIPKRGTWISTHVRCLDVPPHPPSVSVAPPPSNMTGRAAEQAAVANPGCTPCHQLIDPLGFGLEQFDAVGRFRTFDNGFPIDASGMLPQVDPSIAFVGARELGHALSQDTNTLDCAATQVLRQALRTTARNSDNLNSDASRQAMRAVFEGTGKNLKELVIAAVTTPEFLAP